MLMLPGLVSADVSIRDTTITWPTFDYELNADNTMAWSTDTPYDTVTREFSGKVLENEYLRVTVVPEFGGRILSMIYKPTGHEELYQNPVGAPYGIGENWFYYKWLMVYGGIFPTLPEPEHGKAWLVPWESEIVTETADTIRFRMSWRDSVQLEDIDTGKWKYGMTYLRCNYTVSLISGASSLEAEVTLSNDASVDLDYEYWTCLTLAPGSEQGNPATTAGAELIIPATKVKIPSWYPDIAGQETPIPGEDGVYTFSELRYWENWSNDGIAYPWDDANENYWGVINHDNEEGLIRIAENNITPGIKIWAWGYPQSRDINPYEMPHSSRRPYLELWAGHSREFFEPAYISANSDKKWKEIYVPTVGLSNVTHANKQIVADFRIEGGSESRTVSLDFVPTSPDTSVEVSISIDGQHQQELTRESVSPDPVNGNRVQTALPANQMWTANDSLRFTITSPDNHLHLADAIPLDTITTGVRSDAGTALPQNVVLYQNYPNPFNGRTTIEYSIGSRSHVEISVFSITGQLVTTLVDAEKSSGKYSVHWSPQVSSGIYYYKIRAQSNEATTTDYRKLVIIK